MALLCFHSAFSLFQPRSGLELLEKDHQLVPGVTMRLEILLDLSIGRLVELWWRPWKLGSKEDDKTPDQNQ